MRLGRIHFDFSLGASPEHARWLGIVEHLPYAARGRHGYVVHLSRLTLAAGMGAAAVALVCDLIVWAAIYRPLEADLGPWGVAVLHFSPAARRSTSQELSRLAAAPSSANRAWLAHDLLVRALALDPDNQPARLALARQLEREGFRPRALAVLQAGFSAGVPGADYLLAASSEFAGAGDPALVTRLIAPAYGHLPAATPPEVRRTVVRAVVQAYIDQGLHADAIAFASSAGFSGDESLAASHLRARELLDHGRANEAALLLGDLALSGHTAPTTALLFIEASIGKGDTAAALKVAQDLGRATLDLDERIALLHQLRRLAAAEGERTRALTELRDRGGAGLQQAETIARLYRKVIDDSLGSQPAPATVARVAGFLGGAPDSATLRDLASRFEGNAVARRLWASGLADALMLEGDAHGALQVYLDQLGGKLQQGDDPNAAVQCSLLYYLNYNGAPLVAELGRTLSQQAMPAAAYARIVRILLSNRRWDGAQQIASLGLGLYSGNRDLRALADRAEQAGAQSASQAALATAPDHERSGLMDRDTVLRQTEQHLNAHNGSAALLLLEQIDRNNPPWRPEAAEAIAWMRVRALTAIDQPLLALTAAGDYIGTDPVRARRLHDWIAERAGEAESAGWLAPLAGLFQKRFPDLPPLNGRLVQLSGPAASPAARVSEIDRRIESGQLADALVLLDQAQADPRFPAERRADLQLRRTRLAVALGRPADATLAATALLQEDSGRARDLAVLAEQQALLALSLARCAEDVVPGSARQSRVLAALVDAGPIPRPQPAPAPDSPLRRVEQLLADGRYDEAESAYRTLAAAGAATPGAPREWQELLGSAFTLASLEPEQARMVATALCARKPGGPALVRALLSYHRTAQNETAVRALQSALTHHEDK